MFTKNTSIVAGQKPVDFNTAVEPGATGRGRMPSRNVLFLLFNLLAFILFYAPLKGLFILSFHNELYSHIILIPVVSGYLFWSGRKTIFSGPNYELRWGGAFMVFGLAIYVLGAVFEKTWDQNDHFSLMAFAAVLFWVGGFICFYGGQTAGKAAFPLLFLVFMIPLPMLLVEKIVLGLQSASAEITYGIFRLLGVPVFRDGFVFQLTGISIEVAQQCSGIRSSLALFITSVLAGHLFLETRWKKVILALAAFPIAIFKNGLRIVTLSLLGSYVDERYVTQSLLHREGGIPFFVLALVFLGVVLWVLQRGEKRRGCVP